jgi:hypothetical protein
MANLIRVLEATLKGPWRSSQRPTNKRPHGVIEQRRLRAATPIFSPERAARQGRTGLTMRLRHFRPDLCGASSHLE